MVAFVRVRRIIKQEIDAPGLGTKIKNARDASSRSLSALCREVGISRNYWYQLEAEKVMGGITEEMLRKIEAVLGADFGVNFDSGEKP